jgi:hypothetical protein
VFTEIGKAIRLMSIEVIKFLHVFYMAGWILFVEPQVALPLHFEIRTIKGEELPANI